MSTQGSLAAAVAPSSFTSPSSMPVPYTQVHPSVMGQILLSPLTTMLILIIVTVYTYNQPNIFNISPLHVKKYSYNYNEIVKEKQYKKIWSSLFYHQSFIHLMFTINILWGKFTIYIYVHIHTIRHHDYHTILGCVRYVEMSRGVFYVLNHTIILGLLCVCLYLVTCHGIATYANGRFSVMLQQVIAYSYLQPCTHTCVYIYLYVCVYSC